MNITAHVVGVQTSRRMSRRISVGNCSKGDLLGDTKMRDARVRRDVKEVEDGGDRTPWLW